MIDFHKSRAWRRLAKEHKTFRCACKSKDDIQSAHYLPQKRFPMMRLWKANLYISCGKCNRELGDKIKWSPQAIKLLVIYAILWAVHMMIKIFIGLIIIIMVALMAAITYRYYYLDTTKNDSIITNQLKAEGYEILNHAIDFIEQSHSQRH